MLIATGKGLKIYPRQTLFKEKVIHLDQLEFLPDFPLHSMQKCIKTVVLLDRPPFVPSAGDIVFLLLFSKVMSLNDTMF